MTDRYQDWVAKSVTREEVIGTASRDAYVAALQPFLFRIGEDDVCPPGFHWCVAVPRHEAGNLGPDGAEARGLFLPPVTLPRRMWAGGLIETLRPLRVGDPVRRLSTISDVKSRQGKSGALCVVSVTHEFSVHGEIAMRERHDILFRAAATEPVSLLPEPLPPHDLLWQVEATPLLLFRFSAVTFNGHRIHYDLPYATEVEGYAGLLVHGPLQAALALNQASQLRGSVPRLFEYRCVAPLIAGETFTVQSRAGSTVVADARGIMTLQSTLSD